MGVDTSPGGHLGAPFFCHHNRNYYGTKLSVQRLRLLAILFFRLRNLWNVKSLGNKNLNHFPKLLTKLRLALIKNKISSSLQVCICDGERPCQPQFQTL